MENHLQKEVIISLRVSNLFGRFDHNIRFPETNDISIITAPNGYGKTVLLRIINSIFNKDLQFFRKIDFVEIVVGLSSKKSISISKTKENGLTEEENSDDVITFNCSGFGADTEKYILPIGISSRGIRHIEEYLPVERLDRDRWFEFATEKVISTDEMLRAYSNRLPDDIRDPLIIPEWLQIAIGSVTVHLVETQRLLYLDEPQRHRQSHRRRITPSSVVEKDASDLAERIGRLLQKYANESQKLDQTFPKRILSFREGEVSGEHEIRDNLETLTLKRDDLESVGLLGSTISEPIQPSDNLQQENIRRILEIYVEDTNQKLSIFDETYNKIRLFKQILDARFSFKTIEIDPHEGIKAIDEDNSQFIPLAELSSGEQHELVLIYELLFMVEEGAIILIDEPELSLHVSWQKNFIEDLQKIQALKKLRVVIATHSPQIIHDKWDLVEELSA